MDKLTKEEILILQELCFEEFLRDYPKNRFIDMAQVENFKKKVQVILVKLQEME
jgi:hypothetical protein